MPNRSLKNLRNEVEKILLESSKKNKYLNTDTAFEQLAEELSLHEVELELQNKTLLETQSELEHLFYEYHTLYEMAPVPYITINKNGLIKKINRAGCGLLGISAQILINKSFSRYIDPEYRITFTHFRKSLSRSTASLSCELKLLRKNEPAIYVHADGKSLKKDLFLDSDLLICLLDITSEKKASEVTYSGFVDLNNNNAKFNYELSFAVLHELNQALATITNYLNGCISRIEQGNFHADEILQAIKLSVNQAYRAAEIMIRMKDFNTKGKLNLEMINLEKMMAEVIDLIPSEMADIVISIKYHCSPNLPDILLDKFQIQQVILSLFRNAIEAMRDAETPNPQIIVEVHSGGKNKLEISIIDNGPGVSQHVQKKLFSPHFTTKQYGVGLGLLLSKSIIESHGGKLEIFSNDKAGTTATLNLPIVIFN